MSKNRGVPEKQQPAGHELAVVQIGRLQKMILLLLVASLAISVCLNLYVTAENRTLRNALRNVEQERQAHRELSSFTQRLMMDLQALSRTDEGVQKLLNKYRYATYPSSPGQ